VRRHGLITATILALVLALGVAGQGAAGAATNTCTAAPGSVSKTANGNVKAGATRVTCTGAWEADTDVMYAPTKPVFTPAGKWSYGGGYYASGTGNATIPSFIRSYHFGCADWRLRVDLNGRVFYGPTSHFCA
jgi:hypothetical protein